MFGFLEFCVSTFFGTFWTIQQLGLLVLIFNRVHNESPHNKRLTGIETVFTKQTLAGQLFVKNCHTELHYKPTFGLFPDVK
jgi:hypothetical protein